MALSDSDKSTLQSIGHDSVETFVAIVVETFLYAIYAVLVIIASNALLRKGRTNVSLMTFVAVITMFLLDTGLWIIDLHNFIAEISITLISSSDDSLADKYDSVDSATLPLISASNPMYAYMSLIGDAIVIWRVTVFWSNGKERWVLVAPLALLLASIISAILLTFCAARFGTEIVLGNFDHPAFCKNMQTVSYSSAVATTAAATLLIGYKTWEHRQRIRKDLTSAAPRTRVEKIMVILVESGVLYFLFFLESVISSSGNLTDKEGATPTLAFASTVYEYMTSHIVGIYPTIIVVLVNWQKSYIDTTTKSTITPNHVLHLPHDTSHAESSTYWGSARGGVSSRRNIPDASLNELHTVSSGVDDNGEVGRDEFVDETKAIDSSPSIV
ncbi:hypothetical protein OF83DRAFT_1069892 [Amylostereum chailletii]|nr:hypothetical protein OF83DRAFT_1069892 [Amylostereum chailletii]